MPLTGEINYVFLHLSYTIMLGDVHEAVSIGGRCEAAISHKIRAQWQCIMK